MAVCRRGSGPSYAHVQYPGFGAEEYMLQISSSYLNITDRQLLGSLDVLIIKESFASNDYESLID